MNAQPSLTLRYRAFGLVIVSLVVATLTGTHGPGLLTGLLMSFTGAWAALVWWGYALEARSVPALPPAKGGSRKARRRPRKPARTEFGRPEWSPAILLWSDRLLAAIMAVSILSLIVIETVAPLRDLMYGVRAAGLP